MVTVLLQFAAAGALDALTPLPACTADTGVQWVLPTRVWDLAFDDRDRLWVADWAELSIRDGDTLELVERIEPGTHGWIRLHLATDDTVAMTPAAR